MDITKDLLIFHNFEYDYDSGFGDFESMDVLQKQQVLLIIHLQ